MPSPPLHTSLPPGIDEQSVFRSLFLAYPDALLLVDGHGCIVLANPAAAALLGYTSQELLELSIEALVPDHIRPRHASYREAYAKSPRPRPMGTQMELVAKRKDGSEVMVEIALSPLQNHGLPLVVAAVRDIGGYPRVKQALQRARYSEHLAQLGRLAVDSRDPQIVLAHVPRIAADALQSETALVFVLDANRLTFRVASAVRPTRGEEVGARLPASADSPPGFVMQQGRPVTVPDYRTETRFPVPAAYLEAGLVSAVAVPLSDRGRTVGAISVRSREAKRFGEDEVHFLVAVANLLATTLQRAQSEEALNHAQRLESVGQLTGGIAHDFNNLLTVIQGNLQVLEELPALQGDEHAQQLVDAASRASRRGAELTGKLLAFSRRQVLQPRAVNVQTMLLSLADMLRRTMDQRLRIEVEVDPDCPPVQADPGQLESALLNIAINARDAMPDGGVLRFRANPVQTIGSEVRRELDDPSAPDDRFVAIAVSDTGTGMSEEVRERAFEPFFTTKAAGRGTGLGLSTVYGFVKQSKGAIAIDSAPGAGTIITLYIPRPWQSTRQDDEAERTPDAVPPGLRVLMVEDDPEVAKVVRGFLEVLGCKVTAASSGEQALAVLGTPHDGDAFDVLLTDIALGPGIRGTEVAARAQRRFPKLAVLLMSGFSSDLLDADRESPPSWELLRKPYSRAELARAIASVVASRDAG